MNKSWMPVVGGILSLIAGVLSIIGAFIFAVVGSAFILSPEWFGNEVPGLTTGLMWLFIVPYFVICIVAIIGGFNALRKRNWGLALAGAICSIFTGWAWVLGVVAVIFIALSKEEFNHLHPAYMPPTSPPPPPPPAPPLPPAGPVS